MFGKLQLVFGDRIYSLEPEIRFVALGRIGLRCGHRRVTADVSWIPASTGALNRHGFEAHCVLYF